MGGGTGTGTSTTGQNQLPSWLTGAFGGQATSPPPPPPPASTSTPGFTPAGQTPGQQGNLGFSAAGSQNWNPMSMMMWQLMNGGMQQPSGSGGLYGGVAGGMPDWLKMFSGQGGGQAAPAQGTPPPGDYMTGAQNRIGYTDNLFDPSQMLPKVQAPAPAAPAAAAPQQQMNNYWEPRYGKEPTITPQQKLQIEGGTYGSYTNPNDPAINNWIRWNLGEQGYSAWQAQNSRQKASNYANASGAYNREGYMDPYQSNQGMNYAYLGPTDDLTKGWR